LLTSFTYSSSSLEGFCGLL